MDLKLNFYEVDFNKITNEQIEESDNLWINMWEVFTIRKDEEKFLYKLLDKFKNINQIIFINYNNLDNHSQFEDILDGFNNVRMLEK